MECPPQPKPDLIISTPPAPDSTPAVGSTVTFTGTVKNTGGKKITNETFYNRFYIYVNESSSNVLTLSPDRSMSSLDINEEKSVTSASWTATAGTHRVLLCADGVPQNGGNIDELDESNNCASYVFTTGKADITATNASISTLSPTPSQTVTIDGVIKNEGAASVPSMFYNNIQLQIRNSQGTIVSNWADWNSLGGINGLSAGAQRNVELSWQVGGVDGLNYYFRICGDNANDVDEENENNNCSSIIGPMKVVAQPVASVDIEISDSSMVFSEGPVTVAYGEDVYVRYTGTNVSNCTAVATPSVSSWSGSVAVGSSWNNKQVLFPPSASNKLHRFNISCVSDINGSTVTDSSAVEARVKPGNTPLLASSRSCSSTPTTVSLTWSSSVLQDGYRISRSTDNVNFSLLTTQPSGATSFSDNGLTSSQTYYYRIVGYNSYGETALPPGTATAVGCQVETTDLRAVSASHSGGTSSGSSITFSGTVRNTGTTDINSSFTSSFTLVDTDSGNTVRTFNTSGGSIQSISSGQSISKNSTPSWTAVPGNYRITFNVDTSNDITEADESNNSVSETFSVSGGSSPAPSVDLKAKDTEDSGAYKQGPISVDYNDRVRLEWSTENITLENTGGNQNTCSASVSQGSDSSWTGVSSKSSISSDGPYEVVGNNLTTTTVYEITCYNLSDPSDPNSRQSASDSVTVNVGPPPPPEPSVDLRVRPAGDSGVYSNSASVEAGREVELVWELQDSNAPSCEAISPEDGSGEFKEELPTNSDAMPNQKATSAKLNENTTFTIRCNDSRYLESQDPQDSVTVEVSESEPLPPPTFEEF
ncbi:MAG: hypothetical protein COV70_02475 [Parcubacteria group bacterium CG11_big_fil_rev_8_21_14_0_20_39_22]|nr:MAG: hypothetical protein COV70_02475 [Parcubacteria group bacterium CG11_big_fil_rev_8_21_14_0_20_39_22]